MCETCDKLRTIGNIENYHIKLSHQGKVTLGDLLKAYPNDANEIWEAFKTTTDRAD